MNMQDFYTGHAFDAYEFFGAHTYFGGTHFAVWAPSAQHIAVETEVGTYDMHRTQSAVWECDAPGVQAGMVYQYWVRGANGQSVAHCDPYGTAMTLRPDGRSIVSDAPKGFADDKWMQERTKCFDKPLNIYEVHAGSWRQKEDGSWYTYAELAELLPGARILRMDQDSTSRKDAHETMLAQFARHEYDILLGTQMVAKGLDFEKVTLVGVLGIDSLLFGQGFRAYESVFSLITQVVGRGGRAALPGRALIQTSVPDHPVLQLAAAQDYKGFYREEITFRRFSLYPPFCSFVVVGFIGDQEGAVFIAAQRFGALLGQHAAQKPNIPLRILGPAPMNITMLNNKFRYKLTLKCRNDAAFRALLHETLDAYDAEKLPQKASVILDFNSDGDL